MSIVADTQSGPDLTYHLCQVCGLFGSFGFGPPNSDARWYCGRHKGAGQLWWRGVRGADGVERSGPADNSGLF